MATYKSSKELEGHELLIGDKVIFPIKQISYSIAQYRLSKIYGLLYQSIWILWEESKSLQELTLKVMKIFQKEEEALIKNPNLKSLPF